MSKATEWISPNVLSNESTFQREYEGEKPFPHVVIPHFLTEDKFRAVLSAVEEEPFFHKESDLFTFLQTNDFASTDSKVLADLRSVLSSVDVTTFIGAVTKTTITAGKIDLSASVYVDTNFLLCHDDRLEGRKIAFMLYCSDLSKADGGALTLYESSQGKPTKAAKRILPTKNTLVLFEVSKKSFHAVEEVLSSKERITIGGWFL